MVKLKYLSLLFGLCLLTACSKQNRLEVKTGEIINLNDEEVTQEVLNLEDLGEVETTLATLDEVGINVSTDSLEETAEVTLSARDVVNNLPINIKEESLLDNSNDSVTYEFLDVTIDYIPNLITDSWSEYPDSYITEDTMVYLMHNKEDRVITVDEIKDKFISDHVLEEDIIVDSLGNKTLVMANFVDETASSNMSYVFDDDEVHLFVLAKVGATKEEVEGDMFNILNSAKFRDEIVEIYWQDKTSNTSFKSQIVAGLEIGLGDSWELIPTTSSSNFLYKVNDTTNLSLNYLLLDNDVLKSETLASYIDVVKSSFGEPLEFNILQFDGSDVVWTEFVYKDIVVSNKNVNLGIYIASLESGLLYMEMSTSVDNELHYNDIMGVINSLN